MSRLAQLKKIFFTILLGIFFCISRVEALAVEENQNLEALALIESSSYFAKKMNPGSTLKCHTKLSKPLGFEKGFVQRQGQQPISVSVLTEKEANKIFKEMAAQKHIPFNYVEEGCHARAHEMGKLLAKKGVVTGKVFLSGKLGVKTNKSQKGWVKWKMHVAPMVLVKKDWGLNIYVIDPSLFDKAVPEEEWVAAQMNRPDAHITEKNYGNRFQFLPEKNENLSDYDPKDLQEMDQNLVYYTYILKELNKNKKKPSKEVP